MNIPLNIDWQQILLHFFNFSILVGGLYLLLFKPMKDFMAKREQHYQAIDDAITCIPYMETHAFADEKNRLLDAACSGIPLVTPGISPGEKTIMNFCLDNHLSLIHIQQEVITPLWKPERRRFNACVAGDLLIIAPMDTEAKQEGSYALFHNLNNVAASFCELDLAQTTFKYKTL